jgi:hypothetical protein
MRSRSNLFLSAHPSLREARARSSIWPKLRDRAALELGGTRMFLVAGDTLGDEDDLFLGELARGATEEDASSLSRALFLELPTELRSTVMRDLLKKE